MRFGILSVLALMFLFIMYERNSLIRENHRQIEVSIQEHQKAQAASQGMVAQYHAEVEWQEGHAYGSHSMAPAGTFEDVETAALAPREPFLGDPDQAPQHKAESLLPADHWESETSAETKNPWGPEPLRRLETDIYPSVAQYLVKHQAVTSDANIVGCKQAIETDIGWRIGCIYEAKNAEAETELVSEWFIVRDLQVAGVAASYAFRW